MTVSGLISYAMLSIGHDWGDDFSAYIMQAKSILDGNMENYIDRSAFTIHESSWIIGPTVYPWGLPFLLGPVLTTFGLNFIALKSINTFFFLLFLICCFVLFSRRLNVTERLIVVSLLAFNPRLLSSHDFVLSDIPFLFFSTLCIFLIDRSTVRRVHPGNPAYSGILLGLALFCACLIRTNGILLLPVLLFCQIIHSRQENGPGQWRRLLFNAVPYFVFLAALLPLSLSLPAGNISSITLLKDITFESISDNLIHYVAIPRFFYSFLGIPSSVFYLCTIPFLVAGVALNLRKDYLFILYGSFTMLLCALYPHQGGIRFLIPLLPFYVYLTFSGMKATFVRLRFSPGVGSNLTAGFWCAIAGIFLVSSSARAMDNLRNDRHIPGPFSESSVAMFDYVRKDTSTDSIIVFFKPRLMRMLTNRDSIMIHQCADLSKGDYYVFHKEFHPQNQVQLEDIAACAGGPRLEASFDNEAFTVYRVEKNPKQNPPQKG
ncbi:MAG: phospholipid carrier-dependent glycosyltransferase [Deltaproteobacteria bacterium]|nr:phospholipid carrier-dependent glycosyltransferase [Deltaproteobacteria bacterium]